MTAQILMVFAFVFAVIAAIFSEAIARPPFNVHFGWLSIALWILSILLGGFGVK